MGGIDKGLQPFLGKPLALHALRRLQAQEGDLLGHHLLNANRNLDTYLAFGVPVHADALPDFAGPLAGFLSGLAHSESPYVLTVPCDTPLFPLDLARRLAQAFDRPGTEIAMAAALEEDGQLRPQPVFSLMRRGLMDSLLRFTQTGGRRVDHWTAEHETRLVAFDKPTDNPRAFFNANTLSELKALEDDPDLT